MFSSSALSPLLYPFIFFFYFIQFVLSLCVLINNLLRHFPYKNRIIAAYRYYILLVRRDRNLKYNIYKILY